MSRRWMILGPVDGVWSDVHWVSFAFWGMGSRRVILMRMRCWFCVVVYGCRMIIRSVWVRDVLVRRLQCLVVVIGLLLEW